MVGPALFQAARLRACRPLLRSVLILWILSDLLVLPVELAAAPPEASSIQRSNLHIVRECYAHYDKGNPEGMRALMDPDVEWVIPGKHPLAGIRKGVDEVLPLFWQLQQVQKGAETLYFGANDNLVMDVRQGKVARGGVRKDFFWVRVLELRNGTIARVQDSSSDQQAADLFFCKGLSAKPEPTRN